MLMVIPRLFSFETISTIEEMEWAIEVCKETGKPVAATMSIWAEGDQSGVSAGECAVRMARAGMGKKPLV